MFVITKDSNNPYNKSNVSKIIIIKSHWLEKKPPFFSKNVKEKLLLFHNINISFSPQFIFAVLFFFLSQQNKHFCVNNKQTK